ncbi:hypothetical protein [Aureimonas phyllosphaerae]|uniref:Uncharacterized protein n=1 Tax=Aureimonas phyllosphaerae TaxID=1166078 RepID=A0A7W6BXC9_9HYPH|nr:hypothetical protein [Aureimonas phyllosphaerae]MBB3938150.1 hypothetical protein [Aureimonas phyllosphaerae]MBB3962158.1 hypothetical protein [Aureimonas phyllosphaerae]SFF56651.1 hypothetical protein SAMN05216566_13022 [Aureimonas phyllosphaerae]
MANPTRYQPSYSFTGWQAYNPSRPLPATNIDVEFQNLQLTTNQIIDAFSDLRRSDGKLVSGIVDLASLSDEVLSKLGGGAGGGVVFATQVQAEAGTSSAVVMSPLRVKQAIDKFGGGAGGGSNDTAAEILEKLKTVGGTGSGLDAGLLEGQRASFFQNAGNLNAGTVPPARLPAPSGTNRGAVTLSDTSGTSGAASGIAATPVAVKAVADALGNKQDKVTKLAGTGITDVYTKAETNAAIQDAVDSGGGGSGGGSDSAIQILDKLKTVDGGGSGLDADLLDGQSGEFYLDASNLTGVVSRDHLPDIEKDPVFFGKTDGRTDSKLFYRDGDARGDDVHAYGLTSVASPYNPDYAAGNYIASHVRHVAEGTEKNGPRGAAVGLGVSMQKEGFGTGTAKGGEIDALYVVLRQDSPRNGAAGSVGGSGDIIPDRGDGCGILIDAAVYENVGFVGGIEGATTVLKNDGSGQAQRISYQIGCTDTTRGNNSFGYFASATVGKVTGGLLLTSMEGAGGFFENFIQCNTDVGTLFQVDRRGLVSFGKLTNAGQTINPAMHMTLQADYSLGWINADKSVQLMNLNQNGDLGVYGNLAAAALNVTGGVARIIPSNAAGAPSTWTVGSLFVDGSGRLLYCDVTGSAPKAIPLGGGSGGGSSAVMRFDKSSTRIDSRIFSRENQAVDAGTYQLTEVVSPLNQATTANIVGHHVRHVAQGSSQNGHRSATIASGVSLTKEGFGSGNAGPGELDGIYVVTRQDGPRNNGQNNAWGVTIDTAGHQNVGWMGGIAGSTSILSNTTQGPNGGGEVIQQLGYHIGSIEDGVSRAIGLDVYAGKGALSAGIQVVNQEANGGFFANFIECLVDTTKVFEIDRSGLVSLGGRYNDGTVAPPQVHLRAQKNGDLTVVNASKTVANVTISQDGNLYARTGVYAAVIQSSGTIAAAGNISAGTITVTGNLVSGGKVSANLLRLTPGSLGSSSSEYIAGTFSVGQSGRPRFCMANGQAPVFLATTTT